MKRLGYLFVLVFALTSACAPNAPSPAVISVPIPTSTPFSPTASPTETPASPTATPIPPTATPTQVPLPTLLANSVYVDVYDPGRNPAEDLRQAVLVAQHESKRILLDVGGDWCIWCKRLDDFFTGHPSIMQLRAENYVLVKINFSPANQNKDFLAAFPKVPAYPHIFVLDSDGKLLHSQYTGDLEQGSSYNPDKMTAFLQKWAPAR